MSEHEQDLDIDYVIRQDFTTRPIAHAQFPSESAKVKSFTTTRTSRRVREEIRLDVSGWAKMVRKAVKDSGSVYLQNISQALRENNLSDRQIVDVLEFGIQNSYFILNKARTVLKYVTAASSPVKRSTKSSGKWI